MAAIYRLGIEERIATFRTHAPSVEEMVERLRSPSLRVALVIEDDHGVGGFAFVVPYASTPAYDGVGEYMIYLDRRARGRGAGRRLLEAVCQEAERRGHWKLVGKLFTDNHASIALAGACGFRQVGIHRRHGRLDGAWRDVLVVERLLGKATV